MWCVRGHHESYSAVKTRKARAASAFTMMLLRTGATLPGVSVMVLSTSVLLCAGAPRLRRGCAGRPIVFFDPPLERVEGLGPEPVEVIPQRRERLRVERVHAPRAVGAIGDELRVLQHPEVLRDRRPA